ncbi:helix-turn-helix DNA binding protein [Gordonia phage Syleon]|uniref:Helix-turn-helix DNA binding protein n=1 Tax=Gordonia phage Syleon TaxID=2653718 RepID=A0A5Q2WEK7_9CAUD|nr:helix-turn-helix DNA binding protein [Gordonia phage Syleon]QGH75798.1 helix-turn-helix DNA binding protein [Gordonia phage Syleon]
MPAVRSTKTAKIPKKVLNAQYKARKDRGIGSVMVPAEPVREHLSRLRGAGMSFNAIAEQAGVSDAALRMIAKGTREHVHPRTAHFVMQVSYIPSRTRGTRRMPVAGTRRRIGALMRAGHRMQDIGEAMGTTLHTVREIFRSEGTKESVTVDTYRAACKAYAQLSMVKGPSSVTASRAERAGWPTVWDWETAHIDDPDSWPAELPKADAPAKVARRQGITLLGIGMTHAEVAAKLGVSERSVNRWSIQMKEADDAIPEQLSVQSHRLVA